MGIHGWVDPQPARELRNGTQNRPGREAGFSRRTGATAGRRGPDGQPDLPAGRVRFVLLPSRTETDQTDPVSTRTGHRSHGWWNVSSARPAPSGTDTQL